VAALKLVHSDVVVPGLRGLSDAGGNGGSQQTPADEVGGQHDGGQLVGLLLDDGGLHRDDLERESDAM
jgi:hypothetical protein